MKISSNYYWNYLLNVQVIIYIYINLLFYTYQVKKIKHFSSEKNTVRYKFVINGGKDDYLKGNRKFWFNQKPIKRNISLCKQDPRTEDNCHLRKHNQRPKSYRSW
jgi:hypothetical protein